MELRDVNVDLLKRDELKVEKKLKMMKKNMNVPFSPMPNELHVFMQIEREVTYVASE